jgi:uncharacterized protein involved in outer membrane biogenesis
MSPRVATATKTRSRTSIGNIGAKILIALLVVIAAIIWFWNWDWFIPIVESQASSALGRKVTIQHLQVRLGRVAQVAATGISIANPDNFNTDFGALATIDQLIVAANIPDYLFHGTLVLPVIEIDHPVADLRQHDDGSNNYTLHLASSGKSSGNPPQIGKLIITGGAATIVMPRYKTNFDLSINTKPASPNGFITGDEIDIDAHGTYSGAPVTGSFIGGALLSLRDPSNPYPVDLHVQNGTTHASLIGTIRNPATFGGANLTFDFSGQDMANLYPLTGIPIPSTPPYHLTGKLDYAKNAIRFENLAGRLGASDLAGNLSETTPMNGGKRLITADLTSRQVNLADLAGFLGGTPGTAATPGQTATTRAKVEAASASPNLLPNTPIDLPKINAANVELRYRGDHIINPNVPLDNVVVNLSIENGRITLHPLNFAVATGAITSNFDLNPVDGVLHTGAEIDFRRLPLARLMKATHAFAGDGVVGGSAHLTATGNSVAAMLGHGNGRLQLFMNQGGDINALLVDLIGLQAGDGVLSALGVPQKTTIQCLVSDFSLNDGLVNTKTLLLATSEANVLGSGTINLNTEKLDMHIDTQATHFQIGSLSTPINIGGTLKNPSILPAAGPLAARAGGAIGLGILFPPLALIPTIRLGLGDKNACTDTLTALHNGTPKNPQ